MADLTQPKPKLLRSLLLIVILVGGGGGLAGLLHATRKDLPRRESASPPVMVETSEIELEDIVEWFVGYGSGRPDRAAELAAEVSATVIDTVNDLEEGAAVEKGQPLVRLDDREYRYTLERIEALMASDQAVIGELDTEATSLAGLVNTAEQELRVTREEKTRVTTLFEIGHAAKKEYDFASLAYQQARRILQGYEKEMAKLVPRRARAVASKQSREAETRLVRLNVQRCELVAPFSGTIESLLVDVGDHVGPGSLVARLVDPSRVEIPIRLPSGVYDRVHVGASCRVTSESMPGSYWHGQVARIAPSVDQASRTFAAYVDVDNTKQVHPLVPGTFVRAAVCGPTYARRLVVPRGAIRQSKVLVAEPCLVWRGGIGGWGGLVLVEEVARRRAVDVERMIADRAIVTGDIDAGDRVILSHLDRLSDGTPIRTRAGQAPSQGPASRLPGALDGRDASHEPTQHAREGSP